MIAMTSAVTYLTMLFSVLVPQKMWYAPSQPLNVTISSAQPVTLVLTDFSSGKPVAAKGSANVEAGKTVDVKQIFPDAANPGTYILYAAKQGASTEDATHHFLGTPIVIEELSDIHADTQGAMVTHVVPLQYAVMTTSAGSNTMRVYYDSAPHTVDTFLRLCAQGFYDGLDFHRIVPDFVIQGGDPLGNGTGGPGFHVEAEFSDRQHLEGVLSMARSSDPNSAGSQFFICLNYANTVHLDHQYTAYGKVVEGMDAVKKIAAAPLADADKGVPRTPQVIEKVEVYPVSADKNPYANAAAK